MSRIRVVALFCAWLCASGAVLDLEQGFAWVRMFAGYAQNYSLCDSAVLTFDPGRPCPICRAVQRAKAQETRGQAPAAPAGAAERILLVCEETDAFVIGSDREEWPEAAAGTAVAPVPSVPVPPPRAA